MLAASAIMRGGVTDARSQGAAAASRSAMATVMAWTSSRAASARSRLTLASCHKLPCMLPARSRNPWTASTRAAARGGAHAGHGRQDEGNRCLSLRSFGIRLPRRTTATDAAVCKEVWRQAPTRGRIRPRPACRPAKDCAGAGVPSLWRARPSVPAPGLPPSPPGSMSGVSARWRRRPADACRRHRPEGPGRCRPSSRGWTSRSALRPGDQVGGDLLILKKLTDFIDNPDRRRYSVRRDGRCAIRCLETNV